MMKVVSIAKKTILASSPIEDVPSLEELSFNIDQLQAQLWSLKDEEEEYKWEWSMVPTVRKRGEKPYLVLTACEVCGKCVGTGTKRLRQCSHCGRWVGTRCEACWDRSSIGTPMYCRICRDILDRTLDTIWKFHESLGNNSSE